MKAILILDTPWVGAKYIPDAVRALGFRPIFLLDIEEYSGEPRKAIEACEYYKANANSIDDIRRAIAEHGFMSDVVAVTSLLDEKRCQMNSPLTPRFLMQFKQSVKKLFLILLEFQVINPAISIVNLLLLKQTLILLMGTWDALEVDLL